MQKDLDQALNYSNRWLDIIHTSTLSEAQARQVIAKSRNNFAEHF